MSSECKQLNPLQRDGTSQRQRLLDALKSSYVSIDERSVSDLLVYARDYAQLLRYYTETNSHGGDWVDFIENDVSTLVAIIQNTNYQQVKKQTDSMKKRVMTADLSSKAVNYNNLIKQIAELALQLDQWYRSSKPGLLLNTALKQSLSSIVSDNVRDLASFALRANSIEPDIEVLDTGMFSDVFELDSIQVDTSLFAENILSDETYENAAERTILLFDHIYDVYTYIIDSANDYLQETLESYPEHEPHMALFICFLMLFKYAQNHLNTLTERHLRFYYEEVLQLQRKSAVSDKVHIIFELAKKSDPYLLKKDTELKAGKDATGAEVLYGLDEEIAVNHALLESDIGLKSVYIDKYEDGVVKNIYAAVKANSPDGLGAEIEDEQGKWLTFGGTNMPFAEIGFVVTSPMFFLGEGERTINIKFRFNKLQATFTGGIVEEIKQELKYNVKVSATGALAWLDVTVLEVEIFSGANWIEIDYQLLLTSDQDPVVAFDAETFSTGIKTKHPVMRFILDNEGLSAANGFDLSQAESIIDYSDQTESYQVGSLVRYKGKVYQALHNISDLGVNPVDFKIYKGLLTWKEIDYSYPYKYFHQLELEKLTIKVDVKGVKNLVLENDVGILNPAKPFYPFGPIPKVNSSFIIGSDEIFQKSLKFINLDIEWANLPEVNFHKYYQEYNQNPANDIANQENHRVTGNDYFKAEASILSEGAWQNKIGEITTKTSPDVEYQEHSLNVRQIEYSNDGKYILSIDSYLNVIIWNTVTGSKLPDFETNVYVVDAVFSYDATKILTADIGSGLAQLWNVNDLSAAPLKFDTQEVLKSVDINNSGDRIVTSSDNYDSGQLKKNIKVWNVNTRQVIYEKQIDSSANDVKFRPGYTQIAFGGDDAKLIIWNYDSGELVEYEGHTNYINKLNFNLQGNRIVTSSNDKTAIVWDLINNKKFILNGHRGNVFSARFNKSGEYIITSSNTDKTTIIWNAANGKILSLFNMPSDSQSWVSDFNPEKNQIVIGYSDGYVRVWSLDKISTSQLFHYPGKDSNKPAAMRNFGYFVDQSAYSRIEKPNVITRYDVTARQGFMKLKLSQSFLHELYPRYIAASAKDQSNDIPMPNAPYTPLIASISVDYVAQEEIDFSVMAKGDFENRVEQLIQLYPFGEQEVYPIADDAMVNEFEINRHLVPEFNVTVKEPDDTTSVETAEGTLYIGIDKLEPPQNLSLLFQIAEGSEDPELSAQKVTWSYLADAQWQDFGTTQVLSEKTNGLLTSGIIRLVMPKNMTNNNTVLPGNLHWIKASVHKDSAAVSKLIAIHSQAATASFFNQNNDPEWLKNALTKETISKLKSRLSAIKSVTQPYASYDGKMREQDEDYKIRVCERLRHKDRAVTIFDYERLVLERFQEIYKVKCINHTFKQRDDPLYKINPEYQPGYVRVIVVPDLRNKNAVNLLQPQVSLNKREEIKYSLQEIASDFIRLEVDNPSYEEIRVKFNVRFHRGRDKGFYTTLINEDIIKFLSPWMYDEGADLEFGGLVHRSVILKYIEDREYVDFLTDFSLHQIIDNNEAPDSEYVRASTSSSILVSAPQHTIGHSIISCDDNEKESDEIDQEIYSCPVSPAQKLAQRYLGNRHTKEMHDLKYQNKNCQISEIKKHLRLYFKESKDGTAMGYDYCAYCFSRKLSKR
jgi:WD40 repeat protein